MKNIKVLSVVGARPQFVKAAVVSRRLREHFTEILVHTGQHYDKEMNAVFFEELEIPKQDYDLYVGSGNPGEQTAKMIIAIEEVINKEKPDLALVYGDTNSTLAGALAAAKCDVPLGHVEAGLRSFNRSMPEELNRIIADHCATLLFCPTRTAVANLKREGIVKGVVKSGDVMYDATLHFLSVAEGKSKIMERLGLSPKGYCLATIHRPSNADDETVLEGILGAFVESGYPIILPLHPRTRKNLKSFGLEDKFSKTNIRITPPVGYLDMLVLEKNAAKILTDSGGVQKEAYILGIPCITLRRETEWVETSTDGMNFIAGTDRQSILGALRSFEGSGRKKGHYGSGDSVAIIIRAIQRFFGNG